MTTPTDSTVHFRRFAETSSSALYAQLSAVAAEHREIVDLLSPAPTAQRIPVLLFAAVHDLLIAEPGAALAAWYPKLTPALRTDNPAAEFVRFCRERSDDIRTITATRSTQTNEIGRCTFFLPALGQVADEVGALSLLDVGTSAGLNLLLDRYDYRYEPGGELTTGSSVVLEAGTRGTVPIPSAHPPVVDRLGLDRAPIDITDDDEARWLEACVWPDQVDRLERLEAAIAIARREPPTLVTGDAIDDLEAAVGRLDPSGHPVVMNSWVLNYLSRSDRDRYVEVLDRIGARRELTWVFAESPWQTPGLPFRLGAADSQLTELVCVRWRNRQRSVRHLATVHPHGRWLHWSDG